jgi:hypothetical protein
MSIEPEVASWRELLVTEELSDPRPLAGELFRRRFGHEMPQYPRHFGLFYVPRGDDGERRLVAYIHQMPFGEVHLGGGMCVDERAYRSFPKALFAEVRREGGLATIVTRDSIAMLGDSLAAFGHVGEPRARQADLRSGLVDTGRPHLMVFWRRPLSDADKERLIAMVDSRGPF